MRCTEYQDRVAADVDGLEEAEDIRRHLEECERCRSLRAQVAAVRALLRSRPLGHTAPIGLRTRIVARIEEDAAQAAARRPWGLRWALFAVAAASLLLVVSFLLLGRGAPSDLALRDYRLALSEDLPLTVRASAPADLAAFYARQAPSLPSHVLDLSEAGFRLRGAVLRDQGERRLRLSIYDDGVYVVICDYRKIESFRGAAPEDDEARFTTRDGLNLCIRRMGDHVCILATRMPMDLFKARMAAYGVD